MKEYKSTVEIQDKSITFLTGKLAKQANGSVLVQQGDSMVLATAVMGEERELEGFVPLTIDYREYTYASGKIPGGFFKREGKPTEKEIITSRVIDRPLRPLFPEGYSYDTQIVAMVLSADGENEPDILAINAASSALALSDIPFYERVAAVRVGLVEGRLVLNPLSSERLIADLDIVVAGTTEAIVMIECAAVEIAEEKVIEAILFAHEHIKKIIKAQEEFIEKAGKEKPHWQPPIYFSEDLYREIREKIYSSLESALFTPAKLDRKAKVKEVVNSIMETYYDKEREIKAIIEHLQDEILRESILSKRVRFDGRALDEIRPIDIEIGLLPRVHGSALFTRGETQALVAVTLGSGQDAQLIEEYSGETFQRFMLHYNFPPFCVGEVKPLRGPGRREIGHGNLARKAIVSLVPSEEEFPHTIRVVSDILESNGSSSMATVCGSSLALFDAGVPMKAAVAGVAMGLIAKDQNQYAILTDIAGQEDHFGDMDFKVAGTRKGITALQMDIKIKGVTEDMMHKALKQAKDARMEILDRMESVIKEPRATLSPYAPRLVVVDIHPDKIKDLIGPGGKTIRSIIDQTGCEIEIEPNGKVKVYGPSDQAVSRAVEIIEKLTELPEVGKVYVGSVKRIEPYGAFVEILPGTDGLLHISELAPFKVRDIKDIVRVGDEVTVKVLGIDQESGKIRLSRKAVILDSTGNEEKKTNSTQDKTKELSKARERGGRPPRFNKKK